MKPETQFVLSAQAEALDNWSSYLYYELGEEEAATRLVNAAMVLRGESLEPSDG